MEKEYNMTINRLPSKTWNWLRMNETQLERIEIPAAGEAKVTLPEKITTAENEGSKPWNADFAGIASGMGEDMDGLLAAAGAELLELKTIRRVTAVLRRDVVTLLALGACQRDARTNVGALACHLVHLLWFVAIPTFRRPL